ncbi:hypothetical protein AB6A40_000134 [Gnathostoma spinigerum]|uniref:protein-serine/threonine phosphatase n=1 Tax=Gnathostoma spinigerum TaxID=75299 RepID=A0ABD6EAU9_9BILA
MSLITVQRSPSPSDHTGCEFTDIDSSHSESSSARNDSSASECYFCVRGTAVIISHYDHTITSHTSAEGEIEDHLQSMLRILRPQDTITMAVRLESNPDFAGCSEHARYLAVVMSTESDNKGEVILLGFDCFHGGYSSIGVVLPIFASTHIRLDGDGGIAVDFDSSLHLFRPISVQAMWTLFQRLHKDLISAQYARNSYHSGGRTHAWAEYYSDQISLEDKLRLQWERSVTDGFIADDFGATAEDAERISFERGDDDSSIEGQIHHHLKEIMQTVDLDDVTSKDIRLKVEERMAVDLKEYKDFISRQVMVIMGQMDEASQIFPYLYLGTEWNACDWQWLENNGIKYIVNVTNEVENFFPARLKYLKIRVNDDASAELMKYWNQTNQFIKEAKDQGSSVLVHCKKGISRSSSTVIAFAMKEYGWGLEEAMSHVRKKRNCITPNKGFVEQLETFEGMLHAFKKRGNFDTPHQSEPQMQSSAPRREKMTLRHTQSAHKSLHLTCSPPVADGLGPSNRSKEPMTARNNIVKSLVGNFEAIGKRQNINRNVENNYESSSVSRNLNNLDESSVTFRLGDVAEWNKRQSVPVSSGCSTPSSLRQFRAVTISQ